VPIVEVSGRTYPVEVRYRPLVDDAPEETDDTEPRDQVQAICEAVDELSAEGPGDILVFLSGEREIRDTADALRRLKKRDLEVVPLFARLSTAEQLRVFAPHTGTTGGAGDERGRDLDHRARHQVRGRSRYRPGSPATASG
jgi:ATP-dependent helicase HrpA